MREKIKELWLLVANESSYKTWKDDDEGRLQVIIDQVRMLVRIKDAAVDGIEKIGDALELCSTTLDTRARR